MPPAIGAGVPAHTLLDVRAPVEVAAGALPFSVARPTLTDDERRQVRTCYQEAGQDEATRLSYALTEPERTERFS